MQAGALRHFVSIESQSITRSATGEASSTWNTFAQVYARIEPLSGKEFFAAQETQNEASTRITIRYLQGVTEDMRVLHAGRVYHVDVVLNINERDIMMQLMCHEVRP